MSTKVRTGILAAFLFPLAVLGRGEGPARDSVQPGGIHSKHHHHRKEAVKVQYGVASYYANKFEGRKTYTDEIFRQGKLTAASNTLPMHTWIRVTNLRNHRSVVVRVNDKMHPRNHRLVDLSRSAAKRLGYAGHGLTRVRIDVLGRKRPAEAEPELENAELGAKN